MSVWYFGDSIAHGYRTVAKGQGTTRVGANPKEVNGQLATAIRSGKVKAGDTIYLSTGLSNNYNDIATAKQNIALARKSGANVVVLGVANNYKFGNGAGLNKQLQQAAQANGATFTGGFNSNDKLHPTSYNLASIGATKGSGTMTQQPVTTGTQSMGKRQNEPTAAQMNAKLVQIKSKSGKTAWVAQEVAAQFQGLINDLEAAGYQIKDLGGAAKRANVNDKSKRSWHSAGYAIDINPSKNRNLPDAGGKGRAANPGKYTDMPIDVVNRSIKKWSLGWGFNWKNKSDAMHFSAGDNEGGKVLNLPFNGKTASNVTASDTSTDTEDTTATQQPTFSPPEFNTAQPVTTPTPQMGTSATSQQTSTDIFGFPNIFANPNLFSNPNIFLTPGANAQSANTGAASYDIFSPLVTDVGQPLLGAPASGVQQDPMGNSLL